jgi:ABC-type transport system substrate-binding protein
MTFLTQCGSFVNYARFCNEEYDSLVEEGKFTLDAEERQEVSSRTQEIFFENAVWAPLWSTDRTLVTGKCVTGLDAEYTNVPGFTHVTKTEDC